MQPVIQHYTCTATITSHTTLQCTIIPACYSTLHLCTHVHSHVRAYTHTPHNTTPVQICTIKNNTCITYWYLLSSDQNIFSLNKIWKHHYFNYLSYTKEGRVTNRPLVFPELQRLVDDIQLYAHNEQIGRPKGWQTHLNKLWAPFPVFCETVASGEARPRTSFARS